MQGHRLEKLVAKVEMLIRRPVEDVFEAFINPEVTSKFWFTKSTGSLEVGKQLEWTWEMYNYTAPLTVTSIERNKRIVIEWDTDKDKTTVEWMFRSLGEKGTFVSIVNSGFKGSADEILAQVRDSTEGFAFVLSGLKALMEHGIRLNLVGDHFPKEIREVR
jgi:uncharacterized protein YndB with AHSA1/START domain